MNNAAHIAQELINLCKAEIEKHKDENYYNTQDSEDASNKIFEHLFDLYDYEKDKEFVFYMLKATPEEIYLKIIEKAKTFLQ